MKFLRELEKIENNKLQEKTAYSLNLIFESGSGWANKFLTYYNDHKQTILSERGLLKFIDLDKCFNAIDKSSVKDLSDFRLVLLTIYGFSNIQEYYIEDLKSIEKLYAMLEKEYGSKMKQYNVKLLLDYLKQIMKRLEEPSI